MISWYNNSHGGVSLFRFNAMIEAIKNIYPAELLTKPVIGVLLVQDIIASYVTKYRKYPDEETLDFLIMTIEDCLNDKIYEYALEQSEAIITNIT